MADNSSARLIDERARLENALGKLESAVKNVGDRASDEAKKLRSEREELGLKLTTMNAEHDSLSEDLEGMRTSYAELERTVNQVAKRLDATIGQLKSELD